MAFGWLLPEKFEILKVQLYINTAILLVLNKGTTNELCLKWKEMFQTVLFILLGKYLKQIDIMK